MLSCWSPHYKVFFNLDTVISWLIYVHFKIITNRKFVAIYLKMLYHLHVLWLQLPEGTNVITNNKLGRRWKGATSILKYCIPLHRTDCDKSRTYLLWIQQSAGARHGRWTTWIWRGPANSYTTPFPTHGTKLEPMQCTECGNAALTAAKFGDLSP